jgi:hypothetical protein
MIQTVNDIFCQQIFQKRAPQTQNKSNFNLVAGLLNLVH